MAPHSPRSLVGMSMRHRKRLAAMLADDTFALSLSKALNEGAPLVDPDKVEPEARKVYRVGERLRPCPGCSRCNLAINDVMRWPCDGTGVLPAHRARENQP